MLRRQHELDTVLALGHHYFICCYHMILYHLLFLFEIPYVSAFCDIQVLIKTEKLTDTLLTNYACYKIRICV